MIHEKTTSRGSYIYDPVDHFDVMQSQIRIRLAIGPQPPILGAIDRPTGSIPLAPLGRGDRRREKREERREKREERREKRRTERLNVPALAQSPPLQGGFRGIEIMR
jgi:hypothetical protein